MTEVERSRSLALPAGLERLTASCAAAPGPAW